MHKGHTLAPTFNRITDRRSDQALAAKRADWFDAQASALEETGRAQFFAQETGQLFIFRRAGFKFNAGVNVFGILAEDDHIHFFRVFQRAGHTPIPAHRADAAIQVQHLAQSDIQAAKPAAYRGGQRTLDADQEFAQRVEGFFGHIVTIVNRGGFFPGINLHPENLAVAPISLLDCRIPDSLAGGHDIVADTIPFDVHQNRVIRHIEYAVRHPNLSATFRHNNFVERHAYLSPYRLWSS